MLFSIIIPAKNVADYIERALNSISDQHFDNCEIIVVEDHSSDITIEKINKYLNKSNNTKVILSEEYGVSAARNIGLNTSTGQYVLFMDADDYYSNNALKIIETTIRRHPEADIIFSGYNRVSEDGSIISSFSYEYCHETGIEAMCNYLNKTSFTHLGALCFKRDFLLNNDISFKNGLDYAEDILFVSQAFYHSKFVVSTDKVIYSWTLRMHSAMYSCTLKRFDSIKSMIYLRNSISPISYEIINYSIGNQYSMLLLDTINTLVWMGIDPQTIRKAIKENVDWSIIPHFAFQSTKIRKPMFFLKYFRILYLYRCKALYVPNNFKKIGVKKFEK